MRQPSPLADLGGKMEKDNTSIDDNLTTDNEKGDNNGAAPDNVTDGGTSELEKASATIANQNATIEKLLEMQKDLQTQIGVLLRNGAAITDEPNTNANDDNKSINESEYKTLAELGGKIGKREYMNINKEE